MIFKFDITKYIERLKQTISILNKLDTTRMDCLIEYDLLLNNVVRDYFSEFSKDQIESHIIAMCNYIDSSNSTNQAITQLKTIKTYRKLV